MEVPSDTQGVRAKSAISSEGSMHRRPSSLHRFLKAAMASCLRSYVVALKPTRRAKEARTPPKSARMLAVGTDRLPDVAIGVCEIVKYGPFLLNVYKGVRWEV